MKYNKNWIEQKENQLNAEICEAFYLYRKIINREFSWNIFIEYQNILVHFQLTNGAMKTGMDIEGRWLRT